eukprot:7331704-Prymnesium_polylepis.1
MPPLFESTQDAINHVNRNHYRSYEMFKLKPGCGVAAADSSFRKISIFLHPDRTQAVGAREAFEAANKARELIKSAEVKRPANGSVSTS